MVARSPAALLGDVFVIPTGISIAAIAALAWSVLAAGLSRLESVVWRDSDTVGRAMLARQPQSYRDSLITPGDRLAIADAHRRFHVEVVALGGNRQLCTLYESVLVRLQLYMAVNLRREAEVAEPSDGVHRHERLLAAIAEGDSASIIAALSGHGARTYLP